MATMAGSWPGGGSWRVGLACAVGAGLAAQDAGPTAATRVLPNGLKVEYVVVPNADGVSLALALPVGWCHDPAGRTGCAELLRWTLELAQRDAAPGTRLHVEARPSHTLLWHKGPARLLVDRLRFLERLLAGRLEISSDLHALALGRARLLADDSSWLRPGPMILQKAWRTLQRGQPGGRRHFGIPAELATLDRAALTARYRAAYGPVGTSLVVIGELEPGVWDAAVARLGAVAANPGPGRPVVHDSAPAVVAAAPHSMVGGPFVTAAFQAVAPSDPEYPAFVLGIAVLQSRALVAFGSQRGMEWQADFPFVGFEYWKDDPVVRINRRGPHASAAAVPRGEIEDLLRSIRRRGLQPGQLDVARREVARVLAVPPFDGLPGPLLAVRARYLATASCLGWSRELAVRVAAVGLDEVERVLRSRLDPGRLAWFELTPTPATVQRLNTLFGSKGSFGERRDAPRFP
jgi:hypothetical protein